MTTKPTLAMTRIGQAGWLMLALRKKVQLSHVVYLILTLDRFTNYETTHSDVAAEEVGFANQPTDAGKHAEKHAGKQK